MNTATLAAPIGTRTRHYPAVIEAARLVVSELVTNVALHAPGEADPTIGYEGGHAIVTCADRGDATLPQLDRPADADGEHGRGLLLVRGMCSQVWTRRRLGSGKRIIACIAEGATP